MSLHLPVFQKRASFFMLTTPSDVLIFVMPFTKACVDLSPEITVRALMKLPHLSLMRTLTVPPPHFHLTVHEHGGLSPEVPESEEHPDGWGTDSPPQAPVRFLFDYTTGRLRSARQGRVGGSGWVGSQDLWH